MWKRHVSFYIFLKIKFQKIPPKFPTNLPSMFGWAAWVGIWFQWKIYKISSERQVTFKIKKKWHFPVKKSAKKIVKQTGECV